MKSIKRNKLTDNIEFRELVKHMLSYEITHLAERFDVTERTLRSYCKNEKNGLNFSKFDEILDLRFYKGYLVNVGNIIEQFMLSTSKPELNDFSNNRIILILEKINNKLDSIIANKKN